MDSYPPTSRPNIAPIYLKIGRAKDHFEKLSSIIAEFIKDGPYTFTAYDDPEKGLHVVRVELKYLTEDVPLLVGEIAYHLRSALDHLAWQLALLNTKSPHRETSFPIHEDRMEKSEDRLRKRIWDIPCAAGEIIKSLQPYHRGADFQLHPLWKLNKLCNIDKHRLLVLSGIVTPITLVAAGPSNARFSDIEQGQEITVPLSEKSELKLKAGTPTIEFGEPINAVGGKAFILRFSEFVEIYNFVANDAIPRFVDFLVFE